MATPSFTIGQEIFAVLFSILYGVMLGGLSRLQPFPFERARIGFVDRNGEDILRWKKKKFSECQREFDSEINQEKNPKRRQKKQERGLSGWLVCMWRKRIVYSIILLNVCPAIYFWFVLIALGEVKTLEETFSPLIFAIIFWAALGVFGFYRFYHALICCGWRSLFCDIAKRVQQNSEGEYLTSFDGWTNFVLAIVYLVPPIVLLIFRVNKAVYTGLLFVFLFFVAILICLKLSSREIKSQLSFICDLICYLVPPLGLLILPISSKLGLLLFFTNKDRT